MKMNKNLILGPLFCALLVACYGGFASAQNTNTDDYPKVEVFVGYSALGQVSGGNINFGTASIGASYAADAGFETSVIRNFTKHIGLKGDFSAHFNNETGRGPLNLCAPTCITATQDLQVKTRVYNFLAGPEFKARNSTRLTPFAHVLAGVAHTSANFTSPGPTFNLLLKRSDTGFAMGLGGGLDIRATKRVSVRAQLDYNPAFVHDSNSGTRDFVRFSLGALFH